MKHDWWKDSEDSSGKANELSESIKIFVTHRLSNLINFDKIFVLNKGRIIEFGTMENYTYYTGYLNGSMQKIADLQKLIEYIKKKWFLYPLSKKGWLIADVNRPFFSNHSKR